MSGSTLSLQTDRDTEHLEADPLPSQVTKEEAPMTKFPSRINVPGRLSDLSAGMPPSPSSSLTVDNKGEVFFEKETVLSSGSKPDCQVESPHKIHRTFPRQSQRRSGKPANIAALEKYNFVFCVCTHGFKTGIVMNLIM
jgi:hypothetical protein